MIRQATLEDMSQLDRLLEEHFQYEKKIDSYTAFQRGIFPTYSSIESAVKAGVVYVYDDKGTIYGSVIFDQIQPPEYPAVHEDENASPHGSLPLQKHRIW